MDFPALDGLLLLRLQRLAAVTAAAATADIPGSLVLEPVES